MSRRHWLKVTGGVAGALALAGCSGDTEYEDGGESDGNSDDSSDSSSDKKLKILNDEWYVEDYTAGVKGTAENVSGDTLGYISIKVKFYDDSDALIESSLDNINDLEAGGKWKFDVMFPGTNTEDVSSYKIGVGEGF